MKNILILGGAGLFSHKIVQTFSESGHKTIVLDNLLTGKNEHIRWSPLIKANLTDTHRIEKAIREYNLDLILNTVTDYNSPLSSFANRKNEIENLMSTVRALKTKPEVRAIWLAYEKSTCLPQIKQIIEESQHQLGLHIELKTLSDFSPNSLSVDFV